MIKVTKHLMLADSEVKLSFIASPGPGGQNVNKVATAVQLRFNVVHSPSLSEEVRARLILQVGKRMTSEGDLIIKASRHRTQERNKHDAIKRLIETIRLATIRPKIRKKTKPTAASIQKRLDQKKRLGAKKSARRNQSDREGW